MLKRKSSVTRMREAVETGPLRILYGFDSVINNMARVSNGTPYGRKGQLKGVESVKPVFLDLFSLRGKIASDKMNR